MKDKNFLIFIYDKLKSKGEDEHSGHMNKLRAVIESTPSHINTPASFSRFNTIEELKQHKELTNDY